MANLSPMMQQYMRLKEQNPDTLLFFRVGDFYEMFFDDALTASRELELTLTGKDCGLAERAPMCGVPHHAVDAYIARLVEKGYRVAIGEQMEDQLDELEDQARDYKKTLQDTEHQIDNGSQREAHFNFLGRAAKRKIIVVFLHGKNLPIMLLKRAARAGKQPRAPSPVEFDVFRKNPIRSEIYILRETGFLSSL